MEKTQLILFKIQKWQLSHILLEFDAPLHKQIITLQKFNIHISINIFIKTHQFVCIRQALSEF